ncbi:CoA-binding protein [Candidatus Bathyarchaeota archaeon]|nr:MAG: CoA-binding protein [Candidatus Bathyarchaeota archaeon]
MEPSIIAEFIDKKNVIAVVGASRNPEKYGHKVYKDLKEAGYKVYPVNPNASEILGDKCYPNLESLPERPDVVTVVVPPRVTEKIVKACKDLGIWRVWMQPGSESEKAITFCRENGIKVIHGVCIMIQRKADKFQPPAEDMNRS